MSGASRAAAGDGLGLLLATLERLPQRLDVFIRDDDAGWDDASLFALLDVTAAAGVPIDLAAIPCAVGEALAERLCARIDAAPGLVGVHQHGLRHLDHEAAEPGSRKCEFGPARDRVAQLRDLAHGQALLKARFGHRLDPFFTPPWNRCAPHTPALLAQLGYVALSRERRATPQQALPELPVDVDWCRHHREGGPPAVAAACAAALQARATDGRPAGLMLHHAAMADAEFDTLAGWLVALAGHPRLRWRSMRALLAEQLAPTPARTEAA